VTADLDERIEVVKSKVAAARYLHDRIRNLATGGSYSPPPFAGVSPHYSASRALWLYCSGGKCLSLTLIAVECALLNSGLGAPLSPVQDSS
jgi:hypothetical protein